MSEHKECVFCNLEQDKVVFENDLAKAFMDEFPVNKGHMLIVPKAHKKDMLEISKEENDAMFELLHQCREYISEKFRCDGWNWGANIGEHGGQTIFHCHLHLIPRYKGDVENPRGGIRNIKSPLVPY